MRKTALCATLLLLSATGCPPKDDVGGGGGSAEEARAAIPSADSMKVDVPAKASKVAPAVGQVASFYLLTLGTSVALNGGAAFVLVLVKTVVSFPVTSVEAGTYIWGPWSDSALKPDEYRLTARQNGDGDYEWAFEGRLKSGGPTAPFTTIVSGVATPGHPNRGSGSFTIDFDAGGKVNPYQDPNLQGSVSVTYDLESSPVTLAMDAERLAPAPGGGTAPTTFHYEYAQNADGSGELDFMAYGDTDDPGPAWEMSNVRSRWKNNGAGRADVTISGGDLGTQSVTATECWGSSFLRSYLTISAGWLASEGAAASCVF